MVRIVCEGKSDKTFLKLLLTHLNINFSDDNFIVMGCKSYLLNNKYKTLAKQVEIGKVSKLLFILDADNDFSATEISIKTTIEDLNFTNISDFLIMCNPQTKDGYLESLVLSTIPSDHKECIEIFLECSESENKDNDKHIINSIYNIHYPNRGYNFEDENFKPLINKLKILFHKDV